MSVDTLHERKEKMTEWFFIQFDARFSKAVIMHILHVDYTGQARK